MSERITRANLDERVANLNRRMESRGSLIRYAIQARNGATALDRTTVEGLKRHTSLDLVRIGTKSEIGEFLHAMMVALDDARRTQAYPQVDTDVQLDSLPAVVRREIRQYRSSRYGPGDVEGCEWDAEVQDDQYDPGPED